MRDKIVNYMEFSYEIFWRTLKLMYAKAWWSSYTCLSTIFDASNFQVVFNVSAKTT